MLMPCSPRCYLERHVIRLPDRASHHRSLHNAEAFEPPGAEGLAGYDFASAAVWAEGGEVAVAEGRWSASRNTRGSGRAPAVRVRPMSSQSRKTRRYSGPACGTEWSRRWYSHSAPSTASPILPVSGYSATSGRAFDEMINTRAISFISLRI